MFSYTCHTCYSNFGKKTAAIDTRHKTHADDDEDDDNKDDADDVDDDFDTCTRAQVHTSTCSAADTHVIILWLISRQRVKNRLLAHENPYGNKRNCQKDELAVVKNVIDGFRRFCKIFLHRPDFAVESDPWTTF